MQSPVREVVAGRSMDTHPAGGPLVRRGGNRRRIRNSYRGTGEKFGVDEIWTMTDAREHDGQRPRRHLPSSLRAKAVIVPCPCGLW
jgi:hypothetical protein